MDFGHLGMIIAHVCSRIGHRNASYHKTCMKIGKNIGLKSEFLVSAVTNFKGLVTMVTGGSGG